MVSISKPTTTITIHYSQLTNKMVTVTDKAKSKVEHLMQDSGLDGSYFLRVSVQGGGCSGLSYNLDFDNEIKKGDQFCP